NDSTGGGPLHPVEKISYAESLEAAARLELALPTEAQWEYAARAGTTTIFPWGSDPDVLQGNVNLADKSYVELLARLGREPDPDSEPSLDLDDGWAMHCPVGSLPANGFGLHEVVGNVWEFCRDTYQVGARIRPGDGLSEAASESDPTC